MQGRKQVPISIKEAKGTRQRCRNPKSSAEVQSKQGMEAPFWLETEGLELFDVLRGKAEEIGLNSDSYSMIMAMIVTRVIEIDDCTKCIRDLGRTILGITGSRANPAVGQRNEAMRHLQSLCSEFGFTPSSILKVGGKKKEPDKKQGFGGL
jgi:P27 family predicted phage terminase small subunit